MYVCIIDVCAVSTVFSWIILKSCLHIRLCRLLIAKTIIPLIPLTLQDFSLCHTSSHNWYYIHKYAGKVKSGMTTVYNWMTTNLCHLDSNTNLVWHMCHVVKTVDQWYVSQCICSIGWSDQAVCMVLTRMKLALMYVLRGSLLSCDNFTRFSLSAINISQCNFAILDFKLI